MFVQKLSSDIMRAVSFEQFSINLEKFLNK